VSILDGPVLSGQQSFKDFEEVLCLLFDLKKPAQWVEEFLDLGDAWSISHFLNGLQARGKAQLEQFRRLARQHPKLQKGSLHSLWIDDADPGWRRNRCEAT
jgi:hypothetical protein